MTPTSELDSSANYLENFLKQNPDKALKTAISHYRRWKTLETENAKLALENEKLKKQNQHLKADNSILLKRCQNSAEAFIKLKQHQSHQPISLSKLLNSKSQS